VRTDEELMAAYVAGDREAFRELFRRYAPVLLRLMQKELHAREEANDLVQQTFLHVHRARMDFDGTQRFKPWVFTIALNLKREYFRRRKRRPETLLDEATEAIGARPGEQQRSDARRSLGWAFAQLPPDHRTVIELHWFDGLSFAEVANCMGITATAAKVRAHRGYVRLRELLEEEPALPNRGNREPGSGI
jgi:RNA polymerase sigma-70 factor (ECF subfamily)